MNWTEQMVVEVQIDHTGKTIIRRQIQVTVAGRTGSSLLDDKAFMNVFLDSHPPPAGYELIQQWSAGEIDGPNLDFVLVYREKEGMAKDEAIVARLQTERIMDQPHVGDRYRHYKGGEYEVVMRSIDENTLTHLVTYRSVERGSVWTRTLANWNELVDGKPRFERIPP